MKKKRKAHVFHYDVACTLCGEIACKKGQKRCKRCMPDRPAYQRICRYGITQPEFETLFSSQMGLCALCDTQLCTEYRNGLHIDHDHSNNKIRGLLCGKCNNEIGHIERLFQQNSLEKILSYLGVAHE